MRNSEQLIETIESIQNRINIIQYDKSELLLIKETIPEMGEYSSTLNEQFKMFEESVNLFLEKGTRLCDYVLNTALEKYYNIARTTSSEIEYTYNKMVKIANDLKK